ncbi:hypothetical protein [Cutibacterium sp.]|uniref:hypothetical protein n=1 Tax=Cutibacterium sp. TaxID=1912221 RepID=UPI0026DAB88E|nr:hypothetical protein [Cutibacterium sp.]MDO4412166.1 hypothetical protein [Cutibacterium sp.]
MTLDWITTEILLYLFMATQGAMKIPDDEAFSVKARFLYLLFLIPFLLFGWAIGAIRANSDDTNHRIIPVMTAMTIILMSLFIGFGFS